MKNILLISVVALLIFLFFFHCRSEEKMEGDERVINLMKLFKDAKASANDFDSADRGSDNVSKYTFCYNKNKPHLEKTCGPDWTLVSWPSANIYSFEETTKRIMNEGENEPITEKVGWYGNLYSASPDVPEHQTRPLLKQISEQNPEVLDVIHVAGHEINTSNEKYMSLERLVQNYKYLLDIGGNGYSGRLPYLLFSNRPLLLVERDYVQYFVKDLEPYVHYVPVKQDLSDLIDQIHWMKQNEDKCDEIALNAQEFAKENFTYEKILERVRYAVNNTKSNDIVVVRAVNLEDPRIPKNTYIILDSSTQEPSDRVIIHNEESCRRVNPLHKDIKYSLDSVLWHVYEKVKDKDFEYLWLLEDDVYIDGSLEGVTRKNSHKKEDFLASFVEDYGENEKELNWMWWEALESSAGTETPSLEKRVKSFFPVTRYSKEFLKEIHDRIGIYSGYCEVYIPTLAKQLGYSYGNLDESSVGNLSLSVINPMPTNGDNRLYHKWALNM